MNKAMGEASDRGTRERDMNHQKGIRQQAESVLELSNAILAAAIKGSREKMDELVNRRAALIERMCSSEEASGDSRVFLAGVMEHVRMVDAATREYLDWNRCGGDSTAGEELEVAWFEGDPEGGMGGVLRWQGCAAF